jgi:hypothetical protein
MSEDLEGSFSSVLGDKVEKDSSSQVDKYVLPWPGLIA